MNLIVKASLLYLLAQRVSYPQEITLLSSPPSNASYCPGTINFTCIGTNIPIILNWRVNGNNVGYYLFSSSDKFPQRLIPYDNVPDDRVVQYINVTKTSHGSDEFRMNIISELIVNMDVIRGAKIQCASQYFLSEIYYVTQEPPPPPPSIGSCFLSVSPPNSEVTFQWSSNFSNQYFVDYYNVTATHGSSSSSLLCSDGQLVSSNKNYSCSGLEEDMKYSFIVTAINCGDQEGDSHIFSFYIAIPETTPHCLPPPCNKLACIKNENLSSVFNVTILHWQEGNSIELTWNRTVLGESILKHSVGEYNFNTSIQLLISDSTGRILKNESFPQSYDGYCNANAECSIFHILANRESRDYKVSVTAAAERSDQCSVPSNTYIEIIPAFSPEMINSTLFRINNTVYAFCHSNIKDISTCSIQYGRNPWYQNLSPPVIGPMNRIFPLPLVEMTSIIYYYQATVLINSTLKMILRSYYQSWGERPNVITMPTYTFHNMDNDDMYNRVMLKWYQVGIAVLVFVLVIVILALAIVISLLFHLKVKGKSRKILATSHNISSPGERKDVKFNLSISTCSSETGARHAHGHGSNCEEDVIYYEVQNYLGDHYEQCTTSATAIESVNNNAYYN